MSSGEEQPCPECVVCGEKLANQAVVTSKLKTHLHTVHSHLCKKPAEYFKRLIADQTHQAKQRTKITTTYKLKKQAVLLPKSWQKKIKSHTIAEPVILPACCKIVNIMFGEEYEILKIPVR
jgi:hypothetical protein